MIGVIGGWAEFLHLRAIRAPRLARPRRIPRAACDRGDGPRPVGRIENHGTTIVRLDGEDLVVESSILHVEPLAPCDGSRLDDPVHRAQVERKDGEWSIWWTTHSRDTELPCLLLEDDVPHAQYLKRYEASRVTGFSYALTFTKNVPGGVLSMNGARRAFRDANGALRSDTTLERARVLVDEGGLSRGVVDRLSPDEPDPNRPVVQA